MRKTGAVQGIALQKLHFQHGQLRCGHLAAIGTQVSLHVAACGQSFVLGLAGSRKRYQLPLQRGKSLFQVFQIVGGVG